MTDLVAPMTADPLYLGATAGHILRHNDEVRWETFDSVAYWDHNYRHLRKDDQQILDRVGAFFSDELCSRSATGLRGLDVGSGSNLYPALSMLPWTSTITLTDIAPTNYIWLAEAVRRAPTDEEWSWQAFWDELTKYPGYERITDPRAELADIKRIEVQQRSVMTLEEASWDVGTMFFVAESMTSYETEFEDATEKFLRALVPGAPFAAGFMDKSEGYVVADRSFPAVREVDMARAEAVLRLYSERLSVKKVDVPPNDPLREGYAGMIIAVGTRSAT